MSLIGGAGSGKGNSQNRTDSTSSTTNTQTTVNQVDNRVYQSDANALLALTDISGDAFNLGRDALDANASVVNAGLDVAQRANQAGLDFASDVTNTAIDASTQAGDRLARFATDALDSNTSLISRVIDFAGDLFGQAVDAQSGLADQNLKGLTQLTGQLTATSDDRFVKLITVVAIAAAVILVVPKVIK